METLLYFISLILFIGLIFSPILVLKFVNKFNIKYKFISYLIIGSILSVFIMMSFAWWTYYSDLILLKHYGYNFEGASEAEFYKTVLSENRDKAKRLKTGINGIGWVLKAILSFVFYSPYLLIVYFINYLIRRG
ncbi:MAG TPA: hypothetical protein VLY87_01560 [Flavobacterium sp.]|nr:hypothetical protein [Flavobacterium sp.]